MGKRKVILITDGDSIARKAVEMAAKKVGGRCISRSEGNPTPLSGQALVELILQAEGEPILVMFDDSGDGGQGAGEQAMKWVANHPDIDVLGAIVVASNCHGSHGTPVHMSLDRYGKLVGRGVDKDGKAKTDGPLYIFGDTVDVLNELSVPLVIGIGDLGKMKKRDDVELGAPVTEKAIRIILNQYARCQSADGKRGNRGKSGERIG